MEVTQKFKNDVLKFGRQISVKLTFSDGKIIEKEGIVSCTRSFVGDLFKSIMIYIDVELKGFIDVVGKNIEVEFGVKADTDLSYSYVDWGTFIIDDSTIEKSIDKNTTKFTAYDTLVKSCVSYIDLKISYPITIKEYLKALCNHLGYSLDDTPFTNSDKLITEEKFVNTGSWTFRDVFDQIAGVVGGIILCKNNKLSIKYPTNINYMIDEHNLKSLGLSEKWGPVNSLVLSLMPQEDNFYRQDEVSIQENGLTELKLANNELMNKEREVFIDDLFAQVRGLSFYPFEIDSFGYGFFDPYDVIIVKDLDGQEYQCIILNSTVTITTGMSEKISAGIPENTVTNYAKATASLKALYETILEVDKQNQVIKAFISRTEENVKEVEFRPTITLSAKYGTQQVYSPSSDIYTPDYRVQNQMITPIIKIKGKEQVVDPSKIQWEKADGEFENHEQVIDGTLVLTDNFSQKVTTYICTYSYDTDKSVSAELSFSLVSDGTKGTEGKDAATCSILASGSSFASVDGTMYEPEQITLIPQFQECLYAKWQYSNDGLTWTDVTSGQDGLTVNSATKELVISNQTPLLTDSQKALNIKLQSDVAGIASTFTIIKVWTPDQEVFDNIKDEVADVQQNLLEINTLITSTAEEIVLEALKSYTESSDYNTFKETVESQLKLMAEQMTLQFTQQQSILEAVNGGLQEQITNITKYFSFDIDGLTIGQSDSPNKVLVDNDEISIVVNGNKVQTFNSAGKGVIPQLEVTQEFNFFGYTITQDGSGNVNLDYTG